MATSLGVRKGSPWFYRPCVTCGKPFKPNSRPRTAQYCSTGCVPRSLNTSKMWESRPKGKHDYICKNCRKPFQVKKADPRVYCSIACRRERAKDFKALGLQPKVEKVLSKSLGLEVVSEWSPDWLRNPETKMKLRVDIYLPKYNVAIEVDGRQHFYPMRGKYYFEVQQKLDALKECLLHKNKVPLIRFSTMPNFKDLLFTIEHLEAL